MVKGLIGTKYYAFSYIYLQVHPEGKFVVDIDKGIEMSDVTPNCRVALRNDSYTLHKILPNKVSRAQVTAATATISTVYVIGLHAVQFGNTHWMKKMMTTAKLDEAAGVINFTNKHLSVMQSWHISLRELCESEASQFVILHQSVIIQMVM